MNISFTVPLSEEEVENMKILMISVSLFLKTPEGKKMAKKYLHALEAISD